MVNFNNEEYEAMLKVFVDDIFYSNSSYDAKVARIRTYAEIIVRRLLDFPCDKDLTLGNKKVIRQLNDLGISEDFFKKAVVGINKNGSKSTHTNRFTVASKDDYDQAVENLFKLYGYLFYQYFKKYEFGTNQDVVAAFSILPPIIRHFALTELHATSPDNTWIIEKLVLSKVKAFNKENCIAWIESNKEHLQGLTVEPSKDLIQKLGAILGIETAMAILKQQADNMYDFCMEKATVVGNSLEKRGVLYSDFETALKYYKEHGIVNGNSPEILEFNSLMEFVYIGRKEREEELNNVAADDYAIDKIIYMISPNTQKQ